MPETLILLSGSLNEREVLGDALRGQRYYARKRYDPAFVPKPGHKDSNLQTIALCDQMLAMVESPGPLDLPTTDAMRRIIRSALDRHAKRCMQSNPVDLNGEQTALTLLERIPFTAPTPPPEREATVTPRERYG